MRQPEYLSPTGIGKFLESPEEYYTRYLAEHRPPRDPQTRPMSVGSAFDAYVKAHIHQTIFGNEGRFAFEKLFEKQVEAHNRDWARAAGLNAFRQYEASGAMASLMLDLKGAATEPKMEFEVRGVVGGVVLLGKPDLYFAHKDGCRVIVDWKVNGYCAKRNVSPKPGFAMCRDGWDHAKHKMSRGHGESHKKYRPMMFNGIMINADMHLEDTDAGWARQQAIYAWLLGEEPGSDFIASIEQLACNPTTSADAPLIRVASHRGTISSAFQMGFLGIAQDLWGRIKNKWIFTDLSHADSLKRQDLLDQHGRVHDEAPDWFNELSR